MNLTMIHIVIIYIRVSDIITVVFIISFYIKATTIKVPSGTVVVTHLFVKKY